MFHVEAYLIFHMFYEHELPSFHNNALPEYWMLHQ